MKYKRNRFFLSLAIAAPLLVLSCNGAVGGGSRSQDENQVNGGVKSKQWGFRTLGLKYQEKGASLFDGGLSLLGSTLTKYTAAVEGGVPCFGDLYDNGTSQNVEIDVQAGRKLMIRKDATDCKITYKNLTFGEMVATSDTGLPYIQDGTATFRMTDRTFLRVMVLQGGWGDSLAENLDVELQGTIIDGDDVGTQIEDAEVLISTSGAAYAPPEISLANNDVKYFNSRIYGAIACIHGEESMGCLNSNSELQKVTDMHVWVTNHDIENVPSAERFAFLEANFREDGLIKRSSTPDVSSYALGSQSGLGITPVNFDINSPVFNIVVRLRYSETRTYKIFVLQK